MFQIPAEPSQNFGAGLYHSCYDDPIRKYVSISQVYGDFRTVTRIFTGKLEMTYLNKYKVD